MLELDDCWQANAPSHVLVRRREQMQEAELLVCNAEPPHDRYYSAICSPLYEYYSISQQLQVGRRQEPASVQVACARAVGELQRSGSVSRWRPDCGAPCHARRGRPAGPPHAQSTRSLTMNSTSLLCAARRSPSVSRCELRRAQCTAHALLQQYY